MASNAGFVQFVVEQIDLGSELTKVMFTLPNSRTHESTCRPEKTTRPVSALRVHRAA